MLEVRDGKGQKGSAVPLSRLVIEELQPILNTYDPGGPVAVASADRKAPARAPEHGEQLRQLAPTNPSASPTLSTLSGTGSPPSCTG